jgi:hypothetical protein
VAKSKPARLKGYDQGGGVAGGIASAMRSGMMMNQIAKMYSGAGGGAGGSGGSGSSPPTVDTGTWDNAKGGRIKRTAGPKIGKDDGLIPAQRGEYVIKKAAVKKLGTKVLNQVNKGKLPSGRGR